MHQIISIVKELVGKVKLKSSNLPRRISVSDIDVFNKRIKLQMNLTVSLQASGVNWQVKISNASTTFESYINKPDSIMETKQLSINE